MDKTKFVNWWAEGKLNDFESVKFYLLDWIKDQVVNSQGGPEHMAKFKSYEEKKKGQKMLKEHYESNFSLTIDGLRSMPAKEETKKAAPKTATALAAGVIPIGQIG